jgi:geranylgeranyl diphosphate synthase, type II
MDIAAYFHDKKIIVEEAMKDAFASCNGFQGTLRSAMEYMVFSNGKRIRPILAIAACEAKGHSSDDVLPFACALEMIHTYSLIHDDLPSIDNDDVRRGRPSCHKVFGEAVALLAGDALLTEAFRVMADNRYSLRIRPKTTKQIIFEIAVAAGVKGMVGGQVVDVLYDGKEGTKDVLNFIHLYKTTALIRAAVRVGGIVGGAKARELKGLTHYGECIGLAFQVMDDILDAEGDEEKVGKRLKKDANKQTYIKHYGLVASKIRLEQLVDEAVRSVQVFGNNSEALVELAKFVGNRIA